MIHPVNGYDSPLKLLKLLAFFLSKILKTFKIIKTAFYARVREGRFRRRFLNLNPKGEKNVTAGLMDLPPLLDNVPLPTRRLDNAARCPQLHKPHTAAKRVLIGF
jgi:hypothetical protein